MSQQVGLRRARGHVAVTWSGRIDDRVRPHPAVPAHRTPSSPN